jgi:carbamoyltransferase
VKKILGINTSHNVSFAYFEDDILKEYYEEDRFNKIKNFETLDPFYHDSYKYKALDKFKNITFDLVVFVSFDRGFILIEKDFIESYLKQIKYKELKFYFREHHIFHALSGFYFSKYDEAIGVVCDGGGEKLSNMDIKIDSMSNFNALESIFYVNKKNIKALYKHHSSGRYNFLELPFSEKNIKINNIDYKVSNNICGGLKYLKYREEAGFKNNEEGQLMGIAAYKNTDTNLDKNVLELAHKAQEETLQERIKLIEKAMTYSDCKNIILSGGYHLNCSNNFKLVKYFPELNFFVDPIAHDGGTAVGAGFAASNYAHNFKN